MDLLEYVPIDVGTFFWGEEGGGHALLIDWEALVRISENREHFITKINSPF